MKQIIKTLLEQVLNTLGLEQKPIAIQVNYSNNPKYGHFTSNVALVLAKNLQASAHVLAKKILGELSLHLSDQIIERIEVAGPGFINFFLKKEAWYPVVDIVLTQKEQYGSSCLGQGIPILIEFVSVNPTGPLHVGHGRNAACGDTLARLFRAVGFQVYTEYYINDAGRQMDILATSVWLRYLQIFGELFDFPANGYQGEYITEIAQKIWAEYGKSFYQSIDRVKESMPLDGSEGGDTEKYMDALIEKAQILLGKKTYHLFLSEALDQILQDIQEDLASFQVQFDNWFSESTLLKDGSIDRVIEDLEAKGYTYKAAGALWFKSALFGDDKDRVLIRENGRPTYFALDAAYRFHILKGRNFKRIINVVGADHHGYIPRIRAVIKAFGFDPAALTVCFIQMVSLYSGREHLKMSTRSGEFVTLRALRQAVGTEAARFFYLLKGSEQHLEFDVKLATSKSNENPIYYIQYAHARICSVMRQLKEKKLTWNSKQGLNSLNELSEDQEFNLLILLNRYPEIINQAAIQCEPSIIARYLRELAKAFHAYYNEHPFLVENASLRDARLTLVQAVKQVITNGLGLFAICPAAEM